MRDVELGGYITAYGMLLAVLVDHARKSDPDFIENAIREVDRYLGTRAGENTPPDDEVLVEARKNLMSVFAAVVSPSAFDLAAIPKPARSSWLQRLFG